MNDTIDPRMAKALVRYEVISAFLALEPKRGQKRQLLEKLAARTWRDEKGEPLIVSPETIRTWLRRYRTGGLEGLQDKLRARRGVKVLCPEQVEILCQLRREVPERSIDRIITIAESMDLLKPGAVSRSTVHRVLQAEGLSARACRVPDTHDLDRFEADFPNDLWQSDLLNGPWLPDPQRPGKMRRAYLYAFIDDHSRLLLHGRFSFKGELPALELVFRRSLQKYGLVRRVYYDNGAVYRSDHMRQVVATLGIHRIIFTRPYRPMGHGKIEALNRYIRAAFLAELKAAPQIDTINALNEAFVAFADHYNRRVHSETGQAPIDRWRAGIEKVRYADDEDLRLAFLWREERTPDKTAIFSLFGQKYQVSAPLARRRIQVRYDPERLEQVEVWHDDRFVERARPFEVQNHRRPQHPALVENQKEQDKTEPTANWLGHLVDSRRKQGFIEPTPRQLSERAEAERAEADEKILTLLKEHLDPGVIHEQTVGDYLDRFGPFDSNCAQRALDRIIGDLEGHDQHITVYLDAIRDEHDKGQKQ